MFNAAAYSAIETLRDGRTLEIRAYRPEDREAFLAAVGRVSPLSLYRRFFVIKRSFSERERAFFLNINFVNHVALLAWTEEAAKKVVIGGGRYVVVQPAKAEVACLVVDQYQGQGVGAALMRHLVVVARAMGLRELIAVVLADNAAMLKVFRKCGLPMQVTHESEFIQVVLRLD